MSKSSEKKELILKKAKEVFVKSGYNNVTMKDIIEACGISRGGIYLYFSSVDDVFNEVILRHNQQKLDNIKFITAQSTDFEFLLFYFFQSQKERLLHMEHSLLLAQYEYFFSHRDEYDKDYFFSAFSSSKEIVSEIMRIGVKSGFLKEEHAVSLSDTIMFVIEGLGTIAVSCGVSEGLIDRQFDFIKKIINSQKVGKNDEK